MPKKRPYDQFCPIAQTLDVVGDRWTLLIARELFVGPIRYGQLLDELSPISTDVLAKRLKEMEAAGLVTHADDGGYDLTAEGRELAPVLRSLARWGIGHLSLPDSPDQLTAPRALQMLVLANQDSDADHTIELRVDGATYSLSSSGDGYRARRTSAPDADATVATDGPTLWAIGSGELPWRTALKSGAVEVDGDPAAAEQMLAARLPIHTRT